MTNKELNKHIADYLEEHYPHDLDKILLAEGFESAFLGVVESFGTAPKACYDLEQCLDVLMANSDSSTYSGMGPMTYDEAVEYLNFNVTQAYVGEHTPAFIHTVKWDTGA